MLVAEEKINECDNTEGNDSAELKAKFVEDEKVFDDLLTAFQTEAASRSDEKAVMDSYARQELEMTMAFEGSMEYADSIKEAKAG